MRLRLSFVLVGLCVSAGLGVPAGGAEAGANLAALLAARDVAGVRALGRGVLPEMARLYSRADAPQRAAIASVFYELGWPSREAKQALLADVHTSDPTLRLQVQWALGRVSGDRDVVDVLLDNMRHDPVPLFRDKAACALASDQIHLSAVDRYRLLEGLVSALDDPELQVRQIAIQALRIQTGQTKGFVPHADETQRQRALAEWRRWLDEYRSQL